MAYLIALWAQIMVAGFTITVNYRDKMPDMQASGFSMDAIKQMMVKAQPWLQEVISGVDFHFLFFALIFLAATPSVVVLGILGRRSLWSVATYCSKNTPDNKLWVRFLPTWNQRRQKKNRCYFAVVWRRSVWDCFSLSRSSRPLDNSSRACCTGTTCAHVTRFHDRTHSIWRHGNSSARRCSRSSGWPHL